MMYVERFDRNPRLVEWDWEDLVELVNEAAPVAGAKRLDGTFPEWDAVSQRAWNESRQELSDRGGEEQPDGSWTPPEGEVA